jgi:hypothetical protein
MVREEIEDQDASVAGAAADRERRPGLRAVGAAVARIAGPIVRRGGGSGVLPRLKADWRTIVGDAAAATQAWPERLARDGALRLRTAPEAALELQHRTPLLVERINLFFGRAVVARIVLVQGPLPLPCAATPPPAMAKGMDSPVAAVDAALAAQIAGIADPPLRAALSGLGRLVLGRDDGRREADIAPESPSD